MKKLKKKKTEKQHVKEKQEGDLNNHDTVKFQRKCNHVRRK